MSRVEELLEELVSQNQIIIERLDEVVDELKTVNEELQWTSDLSFAAGVFERLEAIRTSAEQFVDSLGQPSDEFSPETSPSGSRTAPEGPPEIPTALRAIGSQLSQHCDGDGVNLPAVIQFSLAGDGGGFYWDHFIAIRQGEATVHKGLYPSPQLKVRLTQDEFLRIVAGDLGVQDALREGQLVLEGNRDLATKLISLLSVE